MAKKELFFRKMLFVFFFAENDYILEKCFSQMFVNIIIIIIIIFFFFQNSVRRQFHILLFNESSYDTKHFSLKLQTKYMITILHHTIFLE